MNFLFWAHTFFVAFLFGSLPSTLLVSVVVRAHVFRSSMFSRLAAGGHGEEQGEEQATLAFPSASMPRKGQESPADSRKQEEEEDEEFF